MKKFEIEPRQRKISSMVKISIDKANEIRAVLMVALYLGTINGIKDSLELWDYIMNSSLQRIDQSNLGEVLYLGMKYGEFVNEISYNTGHSIYNTVKIEAGQDTEFDLIVLKLKPTLTTY